MRLRRLCTWLALGAVLLLNAGCFFHRCGCRRGFLFHRHRCEPACCEPACPAPSCCGYEPGGVTGPPPLAPHIAPMPPPPMAPAPAPPMAPAPGPPMAPAPGPPIVPLPSPMPVGAIR
jgi:hypothetical protein